MGSGYIRLSRSFFENAYWKQKRTFSLSEAWLDLIQAARFEEEPAIKILPNGRQIRIKRGELHAGLRFLSSRWGWGIEKTKSFIDKHIKKNEIERRTEHGESIIKLCKYEYYNPLPNTNPYSDQYSDRTLTRTVTSTNNNKEKESKKGKEGLFKKEKIEKEKKSDSVFSGLEILQPDYMPEKERKEKSCAKKEKNEYAPFVTFTDQEYSSLISKHGSEPVVWMIEKLSAYKMASGKHYKSDYGAINSWVADEFYKKKAEFAKGNGFKPTFSEKLHISGKKSKEILNHIYDEH